MPVSAATERLLVRADLPPPPAATRRGLRAALSRALSRVVPAAAGPAQPDPPTARPLNATGEPNVLLDVATELVRRAGPRYLKRKWTVEGYKDVPPTRLTAILNPGSAVSLIDSLVGPGIVLVSTRSWPFWHKRLRIVLRAVRDPNGQGYRLAELVEDVNVSRYSFRLNTQTTSASKTEATETGVSAGGIVAKLAKMLQTLAPSLGLKSTASNTRGHALTVTDAARDTLFMPGRAGRYHGDLRIDGELVTVAQPSRLLNLLTLDLARRLMRRFGVSRTYTTSTEMAERVLVPRDLVRPDAQPLPPSSTPAVVELQPDTPAAGLGRPLVITKDDILQRRVFNLGFDPDKLKTLLDRVLARLTGETPADHERAGRTVRRLADMGARSRDGLQHLISNPMFTRELELMLTAEGLDSPTILADGGPFTDTHGESNIRIELREPRVLDYINGWHEWGNYSFTEHKQDLGGSVGQSQDVSIAAGLESLALGAAMNLTQSAAHTGLGVMKSEWPTTGHLRKTPWLRVASDALVHVTIRSRNKRGALAYPGGAINLSFRLRDALELAFSPETSLEHRLLHPHGMPTPSGRYIPSNQVSDQPGDANTAHRRAEELHAAFAFPPVDNAVVIHVTTRLEPDGRLLFEANDRSLTTEQFHDQVLQHLDTHNKTIVLVGSHIAAPAPNGQPSPATQLATLTGRHIIATPTVAHTTTDGHPLAATPTTTHDLPHLTNPNAWTRTPPIPGPPQPLTIDLIHSLRQTGLTVPQPDKPILPPTGPVTWGQPAPDVLSEADNERIFQEQIVPNLLAGRPRQQEPVVVIVGGQTGAGKTAVTQMVKDRLGDPDDFVNINMDFYNPHHPGYERISREDEHGASGRIRPDGDRWWSQAHAYAIEHRNDVVLESAMLNPSEFEDLARQFRDAGYRVEVVLLAVPEALSALGILRRYWLARRAGGRGRIVTRNDHDATYRGVRRGAAAIDATNIADQVVVHRRGGQVIYQNQRGPSGEWEQPRRRRRRDRCRADAAQDRRGASTIHRGRDRLRTDIAPEWHAELDRITQLATPLMPALPGDASSSTTQPLPTTQRGGVAVRAYRWLLNPRPGLPVTMDSLSDVDRVFAARVDQWSLENRATDAEEALGELGLDVERGPTLPENRPAGTRIWMTTGRRTWAAWRRAEGPGYDVFDPHDDTVGWIDEPEFIDSLRREQEIIFVVVRALVPSSGPPGGRVLPPGGDSSPQPCRLAWLG
jgi:hypothetical protein